MSFALLPLSAFVLVALILYLIVLRRKKCLAHSRKPYAITHHYKPALQAPPRTCCCVALYTTITDRRAPPATCFVSIFCVLNLLLGCKRTRAQPSAALPVGFSHTVSITNTNIISRTPQRVVAACSTSPASSPLSNI
eukprot:scaffold9438_cov129-Isochrysis_galbana.AAC.1